MIEGAIDPLRYHWPLVLVEHGAARPSDPSRGAWVSRRALAAPMLAGTPPKGGRIVAMGYFQRLRPTAQRATISVRVSFGSTLLMHADCPALACVYATPEVDRCQG